MRRLAPVSILLAVVAVITVIAVLAASAGGAQPSFDGTVYIESNGHAKGSNSILAFRYTGGSLRPLDIREYPTGGRGSHDLSNAGVLDAEQQIVTNADRTLCSRSTRAQTAWRCSTSPTTARSIPSPAR